MASSNTEMAVKKEVKKLKPLKKTNPDSVSKVSSQITSFSDPKFPTLPSSSINNSELNYPSFSKLLHGVLASNSALSTQPLDKNFTFQGPYGMSHQEALASVTAKAAQVHAQTHLQTKSVKSSSEPPPIAHSESSVLDSSTDIQKQTPSQHHREHVGEDSELKPSNLTSGPADASGCKFPCLQSEIVTPGLLVSVPSPKWKVDKQDMKKECPSNRSDEHVNDIPKTPKSDGYSWRKYGQKQVKSSGSSRSYYRCTHFLCCAKKKVQHLDSGHIIEVIYKGDHNHVPPQNIKTSSQKRDAPRNLPAAQNDSSDTAVHKHDDQHTATSGRELQQAVEPCTRENQDDKLITSSASLKDAEVLHTAMIDPTLRLKNEAADSLAEAGHCRSSNSNELALTDPMKERDLAPPKKRRIKETDQACPETVYRTFKEPKIVVHAAGDVGSSSDGYRWRKYGQKMVKGSQHPRSYYRCSSAGCPVRKHVERATGDSAAFLVTYEGKHDHDIPVPKKHCGSPISTLPVATLETPNKPSSPQSESKTLSATQETPTKGSVDVDSNVGGEKTLEAGADKVLESARALLSIGVELKSC